MARRLQKFINPRFLATVDTGLLRELLSRHEHELGGFDLSALDGDPTSARAGLRAYFELGEGAWPEALVADLHRIAELGEGANMEIMLDHARRAGVALSGDGAAEDGDAPARHDPKHLALRLYLHHREAFEAAADWRAMMAPAGLAEFAGPVRGVTADVTEEKLDRFRERIVDIFREDLQGDYCRVGAYPEGGDINMVVSHGSVVSTLPVVREQGEHVLSVREVKYAVLRYSETTSVLMLAGIAKARQAAVAELFAAIILGQPGFFSSESARELYTLEPIERAGAGFVFSHEHEPRIQRVAIIEATADLMGEDARGRIRPERSLTAWAPEGDALLDLQQAGVRYFDHWRLGEITVRVWFHGERRRPSQVTVRLKPPGTAAFRRPRYERQINTLLERNGLVLERVDDRLFDEETL